MIALDPVPVPGQFTPQPWLGPPCYYLNAFLNAKNEEDRFNMARETCFRIWPEFVEKVERGQDGNAIWTPSRNWNPWLERCLRAFTNDKYAVRSGGNVCRTIVLSGCAASGKTHACGLYGVLRWLPVQKNSITILTSTTIGMVRHRIWPVVSHYHSSAYDYATGKGIEFGHMVGSQLELRSEKSDPKHAIFALAVAHGETLKAIDNLKGMHADYMTLIIDEANGTPEAIFEIISNYKQGCKDLLVIVIGNPGSRLDPHGRAMTPDMGWNSLSMDTMEWRTAGVPEWQLEPGLALRFDGYESPNVKLGRDRYPYLFNLGNYTSAQDHFKQHGGTYGFFVMARGLHVPEGFADTVFTEQLFIRCNAKDHYTWDNGERESLLFCDSGFGGDACIVQFGELGKVGGKMCLQLTESFEMPIDPSLQSHDIDYQVARRLKEECVTRKIKPHCSGLDASGTGRGAAAILASEFSPEIHCVQWGGGASDRPSAQNDGRPAKEVYFNKVAEAWYATREFLESGQIRGFSNAAISQFCARKFEFSGKKLKVEPKPEFKERIRRSCDDADAIIGIVEVARRLGMGFEGKLAEVKSNHWQKQVIESQEDSGLDLDALVSIAADGGWTDRFDY